MILGNSKISILVRAGFPDRSSPLAEPGPPGEFRNSAWRYPDVSLRALRRSRSHSAVDDGPFTVDVLLELNNDELLITDYALDEIAD